MHQQLWAELVKPANPKLQLRRLWVLNVTNGLHVDRLLALLNLDDEHIRVAVVQLLAEHFPNEKATAQALLRLASRDSSGLVLTYLASAMQKLPADSRFAIAQSLVKRRELANDRVLPLMVWYGVEAMVPTNVDAALKVVAD